MKTIRCGESGVKRIGVYGNWRELDLATSKEE